jgi:hypothetical protein
MAYTGPFPHTNAGTTTAIIIANTSFSGNIVNTGKISPNGITLSNSTITGAIDNSTGTVAGGITLDSTSKITAPGGIGDFNAIQIEGSGSFTGGINNAGTLLSTLPTGGGIAVNNANFLGGITNSGTISSGNSAIFVSLGTFQGGITNSGKIVSTSKNAISVTIAAQFGTSGPNGGITNTGTISAGSNGIIADFTETITSFAGGISNSGSISAGGAGIFLGATYDFFRAGFISAFSGGITNSGKITAGTNDGIHVGGTAKPSTSVITVGISSFGGGIVNSGAISAGGDGLAVAGQATGRSAGTRGIYTISTFAGGITNSSTISAGGRGIYVGGTAAPQGTSTISTFSGGITNTGLVTAHTGILINSHLLTFTGGAIFNSGTIIGSGGTAVNISQFSAGITFELGAGYSISGNVVGNGSNDTFALAGAGSGTFDLSTIGSSAQYRGFSTFDVVSGTWTVSSTFGQTQTWNVQGGTLAGTGTLKGVSVSSGATLEPGTPGSAGTELNINGNLIFASGADYLETINGANASETAITGTATLGGATVTIAGGSTVDANTKYTILADTGGGIGGTNTFSGNITYGGLVGTFSYDADHAYLEFSGPSLTAAATAAFTEGGGAVTLSPSVTITDPNNPDLASATVSITGGTFAGDGDALGFSTAGTSITASYNSSTETLTLSGSDTLADYQAVLDTVTFNSTSNNPTDFGSDLARTIAWTINDGTLASTPQTTTVSITSVNNPPTLSNVATSVHYTQAGGAVSVNNGFVISVSDPDDLDLKDATVSIIGETFAGDGDVLGFSTAGTGITASYNSTTETLTLSGTDTLVHYQQVLNSVTFNDTSLNPTNYGSDLSRSVTWVVQDPSGTLNGGSDTSTPIATTTVSITPVNQPPTLTLGTTTASWTEETAAATLSPTLTVTDADNLDLVSATVQITGGTFTGDSDVLAATPNGNITVSYNSSTETLTLTGSDTLADYQTALETVAFNAGENPTEFGSDKTRTVVWTLNDGGGTANGGAQVNSTTSTISITNVNDRPTLANVPSTANAIAQTTITLAPNVTVTDPDNLDLTGGTVSITGGTFAGDGDILAATGTTSISVAYNSNTETLTLIGSDTLAHYQTVLDSVTFDPNVADPTNGGSDPTRTITWVLNDGSGSNNLSTAQTETVTFDQPPTLTNVASLAFWTEEVPATTLSNHITVSDPDGVNTELSATVSITGGTFANDHDMLSATPTGNITVSYNSSTETLTLTGSDSLANYQTVLDSVAFNAGENPTDFGSNPTRSITWTVADHVGSESAPQTTTVTVVNINDPPTLSNVATTAAWTEEGTNATLSSGVSVSDPDSLTLAGATVAITGTDITNGTFTQFGQATNDVLAATGTVSITVSYNTNTETLTLSGTDTLAHYQAVLDSVTFHAGENPTNYGSDPTRTVTWTLNDGSSSFATSVPVTSTISVTNVNDPPTLSNVATTASYTEEGSVATLASAVSVTDPDNLTLAGATVSIVGGTFAGDADILAASTAGTSITASYNSSTETLTLTGSDTLANYQTVLDKVTFAAGENPNDFGSNPTRTLTWVLNDGSASSNLSTPVTSTVSITNVNDPPTLSNVATSAFFTQGGAAVTLAGGASVSDPDNLKLTGATVSITGGTFAGDNDVLAVSTAGTSITASYNSTSETLTLSGSDTLAHYQQVLDSLTFNEPGNVNPTNFGSNPTRTVTWVLNDGSGSFNLSTAVTETISIAGINQPPTLSNVATTASYTEEGAAATLSSAVSVSDPDNVKLAGATVSITGGTFAGDGDILAASTAGTSITASYNSSTETLTLSGADTLADYQSVLDHVTFAAGENPNDFGSNPTRTLTWVLNDGSASSNLSTPVTSTVSITNVNDPPILSNVATVVSVKAAQPTVTLSPTAAVSDPDNLKLVGATVSITGGTFAGDGDVLAANTAGTSISASYNSTTETLALTGSDTLAHYQQVLDSVTFDSTSANPTNSGADKTRTVSWVLNDGSGSNNLSTPVTTTIGFGGAVVYDFNGDGKSDLLFQNTNATPQIWLMNGTSVISQTSLPDPPVQWRIVGSGDFNADGNADILWINTVSNQPAIWEMNGTSIISAVGLVAPPSSWRIAGIGDFDGNGTADILWQNSNGQPSIWEMNGTSIVSMTGLATPPPQWRIVATGDFNGDGKSDILWYNTISGQPSIWEMNGTSVISAVGLTPQPANMEIIGTGDFAGNGDADILWLNTSNNTPTIWMMNGTSVVSTTTLPAPPSAWRLVGTSDVNGDGKADLLWQNTNDGTVTVWEMNGTSIAVNTPVGTPGLSWILNNNDPPLPAATPSGTNATASGDGGTMHLSMPDAANGTMHQSMPDGTNGNAGSSGQPTFGLPPNPAVPFGGGAAELALTTGGTTVANSLHIGGG